MAVREILKMGDPRLLRVAQPVHAHSSESVPAHTGQASSARKPSMWFRRWRR